MGQLQLCATLMIQQDGEFFFLTDQWEFDADRPLQGAAAERLWRRQQNHTDDLGPMDCRSAMVGDVVALGGRVDHKVRYKFFLQFVPACPPLIEKDCWIEIPEGAAKDWLDQTDLERLETCSDMLPWLIAVSAAMGKLRIFSV